MLAHSAGPLHALLEPLLQAAGLLPGAVQLLLIVQLLLQQGGCLDLQQERVLTKTGVLCCLSAGVETWRPRTCLSFARCPAMLCSSSFSCCTWCFRVSYTLLLMPRSSAISCGVC